MKRHALLTLLCCLFLAQSVVAVRQYVEIDRRPNNNNDIAGTFVFVFGLLGTFMSVSVGLRFGWAFFRGSISHISAPIMTKPKTHEGDIAFRLFH